jgi:uncharacterized protein (TIGR03435 family)
MHGGRGADGSMLWDFPRLSMPALATLLEGHVDRPVVDRTNVTNSYRLVFQNMRVSEGGRASSKKGGPPEEPVEAGVAPQNNDTWGAGLLRAIERGGLRLEARKAPVQTIVVDHVEKSPTGNEY